MTFIRLRIWYSHTIPLLLSTCPSSIRWCNATRQKGIFQTHDHTLHHCGKQPHLSVSELFWAAKAWGDLTRKPGNNCCLIRGINPEGKKNRFFFGNFLGKNWILIPIFMRTLYKNDNGWESCWRTSVCFCFTKPFRSSCGISSHLFEVASSFCEGNLQNYQGLFFYVYVPYIYMEVAQIKITRDPQLFWFLIFSNFQSN